MPANRNALIRYKTIDKCLRNRLKKWTLEKLIDCVSDALYEYEGMSKGISRRTIQADIQVMRSDKLGYNAPIIIVDKKYYTYDDPDYSITNIPITGQDLGMLNEAVEVLKQFKGFSHFNNLNEVVNKLEDYAYAATNNAQPVIDFEKNEQLKGLEYLDILYTSVVSKKQVDVTYRSFKARSAGNFRFSVWWLKQFKNRWFAVGVRDKSRHIHTMALDRIKHVAMTDGGRYTEPITTSGIYYQHVIGVTVWPKARPLDVVLFVDVETAPYIETKPLHHTQKVIERSELGIKIVLCVQLNYELEKEILGFGNGVCVIAPRPLRESIAKKVRLTALSYEQ